MMSQYDLQFWLAAIVAFATLAYMILTWFLVSETIKLRRAQTEPEIVVYLQPSEQYVSVFDIVVKNIGQGTAFNIRWEFDYDAPLVKDRDTRLDQQKFFTDGVAHFAPGQIYRSFFGTGPDLLQQPPAPALLLKVRFENLRHKSQLREYYIDPMQFYGRSTLGDHQLNEIAKTLKDWKRDFEQLTGGFRRIGVNTYSSTDRAKEQRAFQRKLASQEKKSGEKKK